MKKIIIANKIIKHESFLSKGTGLMFHKKIKSEAHVFSFREPKKILITMFFVFFPIDIIFIKNYEVVEIKKSLKPFTFYKSKKRADTFIELPEGTIKKKNISLKNKIFPDKKKLILEKT